MTPSQELHTRPARVRKLRVAFARSLEVVAASREDNNAVATHRLKRVRR